MSSRFATLLLFLHICFVTNYGQVTDGVDVPPEPTNKVIFPGEIAREASDEIDVPPEAAFKMPYPITKNNDSGCDDKRNVWDSNGIIEGDIVGPIAFTSRNTKKLNHWPNGTIPYYIEEKYFSEDQLNIIRGGIKYINENSCVTFRPFNKTDKDFVRIIGKENGGCLSALGRQDGGQEVSLEPPKCIYQHWVIHELMHAVGFYHQHSAYYRDEFIRIIWDNIEEGQEDNFQKYPKSWNTDYGVGYDYFSIMHYRADVFSKNEKPTIQPLDDSIQLKQSDNMTQKDIEKIRRMYNCKLN